MNMSGLKAFLTILFVSLLVLPQLSLAQQEYTTDWTWAEWSCRDNLALHSPRVACSPNNPDNCVLLEYFSGDFWGGTGLSLRWTFNGFDTLNAPQGLPIAVNYSSGSKMFDYATPITNYALPYDIYHNGSEYIIAFEAGGSLGLSYIYSWTPTGGFHQLWNSTQLAPSEWAIIEILDNIEKIYVLRWAYGTNDIKAYLMYFNGTIHKDLGLVYTTVTKCVSPPCTAHGLDARGFVAIDDTETTDRYKIYLRYGTGNSGNPPAFIYDIGITDLGSFPATYDAIWYWDGSRIFYKNSTQINYVPTTDLTSFGSIVFYYAFNDSVQQYINYTDYDEVGATSSYGYKSFTNQTLGLEWCPLPQTRYIRGLFASQRDLQRLNIYSSSLDLNDGSTDALNITAILDCDDFSYTESDSGDFISLTTPCENNTLTLIAPSGFEPFSTAVNDIQLTEDCPTTSIVVDNYLSEYDLEVRTRDLVFYTPIDGVLVNVGGTTNTTNAQGITTIPDFLPITNADFIRGTKTSCAYDFTFDGTPDVIAISGTKTGYETFIDTDTFAEAPFDFGSFTRDYLMEMIPPSTEIEVKAYTLDNVEIESSSSQILVSVYGADNFFLFDEGIYYEQNTASEVPAQFLLVDNRSTWSVNVTLDFYGQYYQQNATVTQGGFKTIKFTVNYTSVELPCETNLDCPNSFCEGKYFKQSRGCNANQCEYTTQVCKSPALCDEERGCFDAQGTTGCTDDTDCLNESICITTKKSRTGLCGSDDICIFKDNLCRGDCNETTGLCAESEICLELGKIRHRFLIQTTTQPFIEGVYTTYIDTDYYCGLDNRGQRECIDGGVVPITPDLVGVTTLPDAWVYTANASDYTFHDIAIVCDTLCNITYSYCDYGCNDETGFCHAEPTSPEGQVSIYTQMVSNWWYLIFPTSAAQSIAYIFIALGVSAAITYYTGKNGSGNNGLTFIGATIAIVLGGVPLGAIPFFVGVIYAIIAGYLLLKMWKG